ncbi:MAG TPA: F0F1 ATP synthase subunit A, partial [Thiothrix sp.]|nr:F0F1 ATP synthase subunit A [Thiothrix sp.]
MSQSNEAAIANPVEYIQHHLTNWCIGCDPETHKPTGLVDFNAFFLDTFLVSVILAGIFAFIAWKVGKNIDPDKPSGLQNTIEFLVEFVNQQVKDIFPNADRLVGPLALTIFVCVFMMNAMDLIPVDLLPGLAAGAAGVFGVDAHDTYLKVVPTTNLDVTFGMAFVVFGLIIFYNLKHKGP